jgi:hypothetical protein
MSRVFALRWLLAAVLAGLAGPAAAWSLPDLQALLAAQLPRTLSFEEVRESPWLAAPRRSRGQLQVRPDGGLEKRLTEPRAETWRLLPDRLEWVGPDGAVKTLRTADAPALSALSAALRRVVAGELLALRDEFDVNLSGQAALWTVRLLPRRSEVARHLDALDLQGTGGQLQVIIIQEHSGERTTTRLIY